MQNQTENSAFIAGIKPENIAADTHAGLVRLLNEDSFGYVVEPDAEGVLTIIADGIGGHESGNIASNLCVRLILNSWRFLNTEKKRSIGQWSDFLKSEISKANITIYNINEIYQIQHPMGTTIVAGIFLPDAVLLAHAGDSRCYRVRNEKIDQLTEDHSFVAELVRKNILTPEEAKVHPFAHIISKSVGPILEMTPELNKHDRKAGDRYIFCSDGLTNHVSDPEILNIVKAAKTPSEAAHSLLNSALRGGGEDNITVLCVFA